MAAEQTQNINFVLEIEKYPCLYNYSHPDYVKKNITEKAWIEIGKKFNLTGSECKEKWKNIRNVFVRHQKLPKSGSGATRKKPYYLNEVMQFMLPFVKLSNISVTGNLPTPPENSQIFNTQLSDQEDSIDQEASTSDSILQNLSTTPVPSPSISLPSPSISLPSPSPQTLPSPSSLIQPSMTPSPSPSISDTSVRSKKKGRKTINSIDEGILEYFQNKEARKEASKSLESQPKKMFLLSLLPDLESMSDRQMRVFKQRVVNLIEEIIEEVEGPTVSRNAQISEQMPTVPNCCQIVEESPRPTLPRNSQIPEEIPRPTVARYSQISVEVPRQIVPRNTKTSEEVQRPTISRHRKIAENDPRPTVPKNTQISVEIPRPTVPKIAKTSEEVQKPTISRLRKIADEVPRPTVPTNVQISEEMQMPTIQDTVKFQWTFQGQLYQKLLKLRMRCKNQLYQDLEKLQMRFHGQLYQQMFKF